jgi:hypothetical protein
MGWVYLVGERLEEMNAERNRHERRPLDWGDIAKLTGINSGLLRNLENNSELKATNTRFLDSLCRLFGCGVDNLLKMVPEGPPETDHRRIDEFLGRDPNRDPIPDFHIEVLYGEEAQRWWREHRDDYRPPLRRR